MVDGTKFKQGKEQRMTKDEITRFGLCSAPRLPFIGLGSTVHPLYKKTLDCVWNNLCGMQLSSSNGQCAVALFLAG